MGCPGGVRERKSHIGLAQRGERGGEFKANPAMPLKGEVRKFMTERGSPNPIW